MTANAHSPRRWDLAPLYPDADSWDADLRRLAARLPALEAYRGRLAESPATLAEALEAIFELLRLAERLHTWASLKADEDLRRAGPRGLLQTIEAFRAEMAAALAWVEPELLRVGSDTLASFAAAEPRLAPFRRYLEQLERRRDHTLGPEAEKVLGLSGLLCGDGRTIGDVLRNAEIEWPTVTLSDGRRVRLDPAGYAAARTSPSRQDRQLAGRLFHERLGRYRTTLALCLAASVKEHVFLARARRYRSALEAALEPAEIDPPVYRLLLEEARRGLPVLHRCLRMRARSLGVEQLEYADLHAPLCDGLELDFGWEAARETVLEALAPLGEDYVGRLAGALSGGWVDVDPRPGKKSGAYVNDGAYGLHPFMLLNHHEDFRSLATLAHESGHLMHSCLSQERNPFPTARYSIFVGEVASLVNEQLLIVHLLRKAKDAAARLALIGHHLEGARATFFRQSMFAEFELGIHEAVERGESLSADRLDRRYLDLLSAYHGTAEGVMAIDPVYAVEWAGVPHFHFGFYVYQYATSFVAASAIARRLAGGDRKTRERYLALLAAGCRRPPLDLLADAGVDLRRPEPYREALEAIAESVAEAEALLDQGVAARAARS
ncbi:MAG: oligoendopeptidase F family protein [Acidobacteria bacterium]|nr:MAG: oligoendopeptidase F family protein [Acidobacteriota bacterium]